MIWNDYQKNFTAFAESSGYSSNYIAKQLQYAKPLHKKNVPIIYDQLHLAKLVGYEYEYILKISNTPENFYREFTIEKKSGGKRVIKEPLPSLKEIQRWVLENILNKIKVSPTAKAYVLGKGIKENARFHKNQNIVLNIDLINFFPSIQEKYIFMVFRKIGYTSSVSTILTKICCFDKSLPQGSPTSPALSNIILKHVDDRIFGFCKKLKVRYSRYADDMSFSGSFNVDVIYKFVSSVVNNYGLKINTKKTRVLQKHHQQSITGVVVNEKIQAPRDYRRKLRQQIYYCKRFGLANQATRNNFKDIKSFLHFLLGKANYIKYLNPKDSEIKEYIEWLHFNMKEIKN